MKRIGLLLTFGCMLMATSTVFASAPPGKTDQRHTTLESAPCMAIAITAVEFKVLYDLVSVETPQEMNAPSAVEIKKEAPFTALTAQATPVSHRCWQDESIASNRFPLALNLPDRKKQNHKWKDFWLKS